MEPGDLDRLLDRELEALPRPRAPRTLLPRVLEATVRRAGPPVAATGWFTWGRGWQLVSVTVVAAVLASAWVLAEAAPPTIVTAARGAAEAGTVARVLWDVVFQPVSSYIFILGVTFVLACAVAWAALELALGGATQR